MYDVVGTWGAYGEDGLPGGYQLCVELLQPTASSPLAWVRVPDLPPLVEGTGNPGDETRQDAVQAPCAQVFRIAQPIFGARVKVRTWFTAASGGTLALDLLHAEFMLPSAPRVTSMPRSDVNLHGAETAELQVDACGRWANRACFGALAPVHTRSCAATRLFLCGCATARLS